MNTSRKQTSSEIIAKLLEAIPQWDDGPITIPEWLNRAGVDEKVYSGCSELVIPLLETFDAISIFELVEAQGFRFKSSSELSSYFIRSLALHLREDRKILSNWERSGVAEGPFSISDILSGPQFLYAMESRRIVNNDDAPVVRKSVIVKAVIKARVRGFKEPVCLVQFDEKTRKYQLIGGHIRKTDDNTENTMKRELEEELHKGNFIEGSNYKLRFLNKVSKNEISLTCGAYTEYVITYFQPFFENKQIILGPNDRWITLSELLAGKTKNGIGINESAIPTINANLPGGLSGLNLSIDEIQQRSLLQIAKDHPWEVLGIVIGVIGILLSIVFFLLS